MLPICQRAGSKETNFLQFTVTRLEESDVFLSPPSLCMSRYSFSLQKAEAADEFLSRSR